MKNQPIEQTNKLANKNAMDLKYKSAQEESPGTITCFIYAVITYMLYTCFMYVVYM